MYERVKSGSPIVAGVATALLFLTLFMYVWSKIGVPPHLVYKFFVGATLACIALLSLSVYLMVSARDDAYRMAERMTKDMLAYSHELFSELYRNSPVPYLLIDERGHIESTNLAAIRLFNVTMDALNGLSIFEFIEPEQGRSIELIPQYFRQGKTTNDVEVRIRRPDGMGRWVTLSLFPFTDGTKKRKGLLTLVDITKQKMVDKAKTEFVSLASHQLRTPISAMRWNIELLATATGAELTETQRSYVEKVSGGLKRMDALVEDFLSASKLELGTLVAQKKEFDLAEFFANVLEEYTVTAEKRNVRIVTNWSDVRGTYLSDAHLLNMAVSNILGNAIKYTKEGGEVRAVAEYTQKGFIIQISDTGIGIPEDEQDMIFSKLFRASNAQTKETDGTGLGLYIVKEAIRILGGDVTFVSQAGVGTTFTITLPA